MKKERILVEIFDGTGHFGMWQGEVLDSLFQQGLDIAIEHKDGAYLESRNMLSRMRLLHTNCGRHWRANF